MIEKIILIHGWSASSKTLTPIKLLLEKKNFPSENVLFVDYESREDSLTFDDVADGLNDQFFKNGIIDENGSKRCNVAVVAHSTGAPIIRHWVWRYYYKEDPSRIDQCPVSNIVLLAPNNFGSPLAHRGKSFFGSFLKGRKKITDFFEVGRILLDGLELASPYLWQLAEKDCLIPDSYYKPDKIKLTSFVGIEQYDDIKSLVNEKGTDGVVVIAGTPLNTIKIKINPNIPLKEGEQNAYEWVFNHGNAETNFAVLPMVNHRTIVDVYDKKNDFITYPGTLLLKALELDENNTIEYEQITKDTYDRASDKEGNTEPRYQQFMVHCVDDQENIVEDFYLDFFLVSEDRLHTNAWTKRYKLSKKEERLSENFHDIVTDQFHTHTKNPSYRSFLVDYRRVNDALSEARASLKSEVAVFLQVHVPEIERGIRYNDKPLKAVLLYKTSEIPNESRPFFFRENTTTLLEIKVDRYNKYVKMNKKPKK